MKNTKEKPDRITTIAWQLYDLLEIECHLEDETCYIASALAGFADGNKITGDDLLQALRVLAQRIDPKL